MNGHTQEVLDYLDAPVPDEEEYISFCILCGNVAESGHLCREKFEKQIGMKDGIAHFPAAEWLSNCCNAPPAYGQTPDETDYCSKCGDHCEFEEE